MSTVKIAVVGDPGTGKTSLINTAIKGMFDTRMCVPVLPPARLNILDTAAILTDTSSRQNDQAVSLSRLQSFSKHACLLSRDNSMNTHTHTHTHTH